MAQTVSSGPGGNALVEPDRYQPQKVLFIDREEANREIMLVLEAEGLNVIQATNPSAGFSRASEPGLSMIMVGEGILGDGDQVEPTALSAISQVPIVLLHSGGKSGPDQAKRIGAEVHFSRATPAECLRQFLRARLALSAESQTAA